MSWINVSLAGNLCRAPEQLTFANGKAKTVITVAINKQPKKEGEKEAADFYRVEIWDKLGELAMKYLTKGCQVSLCGRLVMEEWQDKEGRTRTTPTVTASQISFPPKSQSQAKEEIAGDIFGGFAE
ncbi:MAG: single-stranded DNA-binding protein [Patescibacteria group bacterium]|nr:single-stranded DNA-binding protein [Patescibacteria group bacterium]